jgi:hypothetical protein
MHSSKWEIKGCKLSCHFIGNVRFWIYCFIRNSHRIVLNGRNITRRKHKYFKFLKNTKQKYEEMVVKRRMVQ